MGCGNRTHQSLAYNFVCYGSFCRHNCFWLDSQLLLLAGFAHDSLMSVVPVRGLGNQTVVRLICCDTIVFFVVFFFDENPPPLAADGVGDAE